MSLKDEIGKFYVASNDAKHERWLGPYDTIAQAVADAPARLELKGGARFDVGVVGYHTYDLSIDGGVIAECLMDRNAELMCEEIDWPDFGEAEEKALEAAVGAAIESVFKAHGLEERTILIWPEEEYRITVAGSVLIPRAAPEKP